MSKQDKEILIDFVEPMGRFKQLAISASYYIGGMNYFSGNNNPRGYRLSFHPCITTGNGFRESVLMGEQWESGFYLFLEPATRFNAKRLDYWFNNIERVAYELRDKYAQKDLAGLQQIANELKGATADLKTVSAELPEEPARKPLLTDKLKARFAEVGAQSQSGMEETANDPIVVCKFFNSLGAGTWYATEYDPSCDCFYGYVSLFGDHNDEWGDFSLKELEEQRAIELDKYFTEKRFSEINK